jgi:divalent metal cation (Fe/Co/Zn/Cd) transporter
MGVLVFAAAAPLIRSSITNLPHFDGRSRLMMVLASLALTVVLCIAAYVLAHSVSRPAARTDAMLGLAAPTPQRIFFKLTLSAALTEAAAMSGIVVYIIVGFLPILAIAVLAAVLGLVLAFPRANLFPEAADQPTEAVTFR